MTQGSTLLATFKGEKIDLTSVEFQLLSILAARPGRILSRNQLMDSLYTDQRIVCDRTIDSNIKKIRKNPIQKDIPILMLTARAEEMDKIEGLDAGADDYMTKPVSLQELHARIRALVRRSQGLNEEKVLQKGDLSLDIENNELKIQGENVKIGPTEFRLLHYLMRKPDRLHSRSQLLDQVWGQGIFIEERTVDVHILRLRKLLKPYHADKMVMTVRGAGYRFIENIKDTSIN